jgi:hypothetical protein
MENRNKTLRLQLSPRWGVGKQSSYLKGTPMKRIILERHKNPEEIGSAGLIEGETDAGDRWILFLDAEGKPEVYWPQREPEIGAVIGESIILS